MGDKAAERSAKAFSAITPLLGLGGVVAGAVPGLRKPERSKVRVSAAPVAEAAMGTAAQGHGVGRGGAYLQSLRAAGRAGQLVAGQQLAAQTTNERINMAADERRSQRVEQFGKDVAGMTGDLGVGLVDAANARKAERLGAQGDELTRGGTSTTGQPPAPGQNAIADAYGGSGEGGIEAEAMPLEDAIENPEIQQGQALASLQAELADIESTQIRNRTEAINQARAINGSRPLDGLSEIAPDIEYRNRVINFGIDELDKRGLSLLNSLAPMARVMGTDLTQILNPPMQSWMGGEEEESG